MHNIILNGSRCHLKCSLVQDNVCGEISVCKVNFSYPTSPDIKVLQELSVLVKPGQALALVGPSGWQEHRGV